MGLPGVASARCVRGILPRSATIINRLPAVERYTDEQIAEWDRDDALSEDERARIEARLAGTGISRAP